MSHRLRDRDGTWLDPGSKWYEEVGMMDEAAFTRALEAARAEIGVQAARFPDGLTLEGVRMVILAYEARRPTARSDFWEGLGMYGAGEMSAAEFAGYVERDGDPAARALARTLRGA